MDIVDVVESHITREQQLPHGRTHVGMACIGWRYLWAWPRAIRMQRRIRPGWALSIGRYGLTMEER